MSSRRKTDEVFGSLVWSNGSERWERAIAVRYFCGAGKNVLYFERKRIQTIATKHALQNPTPCNASGSPLLEKHIAPLKERKKTRAPFDLCEIQHQGKARLEVPTRSFAEGPTLAQHKAWKAIIARRGQLWDELMDQLLDEYREHYAFRMRWYKMVFGDVELRRRLPMITSKEALKKLILPLRVFIKPTQGTDENPGVGVVFSCTYGGFGVLIKEGRISAIGGTELAVLDTNADTIEYSILGRFFDYGTYWDGKMRLPYFREFNRVADLRVEFKKNLVWLYATGSPAIDWDFVQGDFDTRIYVGSNRKPTDKQIQAVTVFKENEAANVTIIMIALFKLYCRRWKSLRTHWKNEDSIHDLLPKLKNIDGFHELIRLYKIYIFQEDKNGHAILGFEFVTSWQDIYSVVWSNGKIVKIGASLITVLTI